MSDEHPVDPHPTPIVSRSAPTLPASPVLREPADIVTWADFAPIKDQVEAWRPISEQREARLAKVETQQGEMVQQLARVEQKTDAQTALLGEIKGLLYSPRARWIVAAIAAGLYAYAKVHHVPIPFLENDQ